MADISKCTGIVGGDDIISLLTDDNKAAAKMCRICNSCKRFLIVSDGKVQSWLKGDYDEQTNICSHYYPWKI